VIVNELASAARLEVLTVTDGMTVATTTAAPLVSLLLTTIADRVPTIVGRTDNVIDNVVAVAAVTAPMAPLLNVTVLLTAVVLKPVPMMVSVVALAAIKFPPFASTTGLTDATCTAVPLDWELVVTIAVRLPACDGLVVNVTVSVVAVADAIVPTAPLFNTTALLAAIGSNPKPVIVSVVALDSSVAVPLVTTGFNVATWTADPLL
jgi:hypothetical protein